MACVAVRCSILFREHIISTLHHCNILQHTTTLCNTLHYNTCCSTLQYFIQRAHHQYTASLLHIATHYNALFLCTRSYSKYIMYCRTLCTYIHQLCPNCHNVLNYVRTVVHYVHTSELSNCRTLCTYIKYVHTSIMSELSYVMYIHIMHIMYICPNYTMYCRTLCTYMHPWIYTRTHIKKILSTPCSFAHANFQKRDYS